MAKNHKEKRILFLQAFPLWGCGSGIYTRALASETNKSKDIKTAVVCPESKNKIEGLKIYPLDLPFPAAFTGHPEWPVCKLYQKLKPGEIAQIFNYFLKSVIRAVDDFKPDLIHVQHISLLLWTANFVHSFYGINYVVTGHGTGVLAASENKNFVPLCRDSLKRARKIIPVSGDTKRWILNTFGKEFSHKTSIIPGGIHLEKFTPEREIKIINKKYRLGNKKVVLFSGKLTPQKGVIHILEAAKDIKGHIFIAGDGSERKNLEDFKYKNNLKNVHFLGYIGNDRKQELEEFYYRADVFVAPSVWDEPLGLVILEAMAGSTPVVATRKGGIPLAVKDGFNGFLIRPKNSKQIADACNKLLLNAELRAKMGKAARETVEKKFTWKKIALKYKRIYIKAYTNGKNGKDHKNGKTKNQIVKNKKQNKTVQKGKKLLKIFRRKK